MYLRSLTFILLFAASAAAQTLSIVSGNGQIINYFSGQNSLPIVFQLSNNGTPVANATITFEYSNGSAEDALTASSAVTNSSGEATVYFHSPFMTNTFTQYELVAKYAGASIVFYETSLEVPPGAATLESPATAMLEPLTAQAGQPGLTITVGVSGGSQGPIPNVAVRVVPVQNPAPAGVITQHVVCKEGAMNPEGNVFTNANSVASCTPVFTYPNAALNSDYDPNSQFVVLVGDNFSFGPFTYNITPQPLGISGPQGGVLLTGQSSNFSIAATGGVPPYTFSLTSTSGLLPGGLTLQSNGQITGSSNTPGIFKFTAQVVDNTGAKLVASSPYSIDISGGPFTTTPTNIPDAVVGTPYSQSVTVGGGVPPYTLSVSGNLPAGLSASATTSSSSITISGTATATSNSPVAVKVVDALGNTGILPLLTFQSLNPLVLQTNPQVANAGSPYTLTLTPTGGLAPYTFTASGMPIGITLNGSVISGTPTTPGVNEVSVMVTDSIGETTTGKFFIDVSGGNIGVSGSPNLPAAQAGVAYSAQVNITGGVPPYTYALSTQGPGDALQISNSGLLTGTFSLSGTQTVPVTVIDQVGTDVTVNVLVTVSPVVLATTNSATFLQGGIAPGEIISIFGSGLGPDPGVGLQLTSNGYISSMVGGTQVLIGGNPAPIFYAGSTQLNVIVPYEVTPGDSTTITVTSNGQTSAPLTANVVVASPGIFIIGTGSGNDQAAVLNQDLTVNGPDNQAKLGDIIVVYATGGGQLSASIADGQLPSTLITVADAGLTIGGQTATLLYAGLAPGYAGLMQFNARIPTTVTPGNAVPLVLSISGASSAAATATVAISQ